MPEYFTILDKWFATPGIAREALLFLCKATKIFNIPSAAVWRVYPRGIGLVVTAEWRYSDPGAIPATEVDNIGGIPVLVKKEESK